MGSTCYVPRMTNSVRLAVVVFSAAVFALAMLGGCAAGLHKRGDASFAETLPVYRVEYTGPQPTIANLPADVVLPFYFCGPANKWIYAYFAGNTIQLYETDPGTSYRKYIQAVSRGSAFPWALGLYAGDGSDGTYIYFVNTEARRAPGFDYISPAAGFNSCLELAALSQVEVISCERFLTGRGPHARCLEIEPPRTE